MGRMGKSWMVGMSREARAERCGCSSPITSSVSSSSVLSAISDETTQALRRAAFWTLSCQKKKKLTGCESLCADAVAQAVAVCGRPATRRRRRCAGLPHTWHPQLRDQTLGRSDFARLPLYVYCMGVRMRVIRRTCETRRSVAASSRVFHLSISACSAPRRSLTAAARASALAPSASAARTNSW